MINNWTKNLLLNVKDFSAGCVGVFADGKHIDTIRVDLEKFIDPRDYQSRSDGFYWNETPKGKIIEAELRYGKSEFGDYAEIWITYTGNGFFKSQYQWDYESNYDQHDVEYDINAISLLEKLRNAGLRVPRFIREEE